MMTSTNAHPSSFCPAPVKPARQKAPSRHVVKLQKPIEKVVNAMAFEVTQHHSGDVLLHITPYVYGAPVSAKAQTLRISEEDIQTLGYMLEDAAMSSKIMKMA